ncbi:tautomerase family protein [Nostoc sp. FACHB-152]|uniref:tautomerase family protein n=1 Tax=unclassified Nostoc TaxID=2593658 RepID=UPI0016861DB5|nr:MULTISPECIES: tautomerase family protein [unclassified Nostoc]MBD2446408.1 tautomerase family protein [Nostoc sp. FACHB-152]MBD2469637.1 tautomerase family protein [Nostoc sp. FACHB-145]
MVQTKIYGLREHLNPIKPKLSDIIHSCIIDALKYPPEKRAHRFFPLERDDFFYPQGRTERYTIIEFSMIEGRSVEAKKQLIRLLFERVQPLGISTQDLEITIFETPKHNWGFRGLPGDEHQLNYNIEV